MASKKDNIIFLAMRLIKEKGFLSLSYDDISKELGITKAAVHYYFERKEDLGVAVCEKLEAGLLESYERTLNQMTDHQGEPWYFIESRIDTIRPNEICPISSLQGDYEDLPESMKNILEEISKNEMELWASLVRQYSPNLDNDDIARTILLSVKGALQYRRVLDGRAFENMMSSIQTQFYRSLSSEGGS
ncbi:TetR/AcrR family transcriptional regulator [Paenibacillus yanchengensis]|uniref:TetR/AcrR family transcriptional regulator n=1 Tax=Paenibacillus yanchengensis TaxID=2035833 RepID=A0ABW4YM47_9BACL